MLHGVERRARALPRDVPRPPDAGSAKRAEAGQRVFAIDPTGRRKLVRLLGLLLHVRGLVRHRGVGRFGRGPGVVGARGARLRLLARPAAGQRRVGRGLYVVLRQAVRGGRHARVRRRGLGRRVHGLGAARVDGGAVLGQRGGRERDRVPREAAARGRRLAAGGHLRRLQPRLRHHVYRLPERLPALGARAVSELVRAEPAREVGAC
mmetsp:Transcript_6240/g.19692  ORF Transcript_6240/g.19692 Transcript_6240/m.19692 type:complete len:207 (-) Transcript_6240:12-632(-)